MVTKIKVYKDLPIEEGKTYKTRFQTGDMFFVKKIKTKIIRNKGIEELIPISFEGIYWKYPNLLCPLAIDRLIPERIEIGEKSVCSKCGEEIDPNEIHNEG